MPTKRFHTAIVSTKEHLIVAGGDRGSDRSDRVDIVEVMDIETLVWSTAASLPHSYSYASVTICGDQLYMLGGFDRSGAWTKSVLTCSLPKLLQSCSETSSDPVWHRIADVPVYHSTCAAINEELVAVGGRGNSTMSSAVHKYSPTTDSWDVISNMLTARNRSLVAVLPTSEMMIVIGGYTNVNITDKVETANIML